MSNPQISQMPQMPASPAEEYPEFWLGQIETIADMEAMGTLTKAEMVKEVKRVINQRRKYADYLRRRSTFFRKEPNEPATKPGSAGVPW